MQAFRALALVVLISANAARADVSGTIGFLSDYVFRGIPQADSVGNGSLDFSQSGFYVGTWLADVGQGLEVDGYGGYAYASDTFRYTIGYTGYFYTDDFDDTYQELNLKLGFGPVNFEYSPGRYDNFGDPTLDYAFASVGVTFPHVRALVGSFSQDFDGEYVQLGLMHEVSGINLALDVIYSNDDLVGEDDNTTFVFSLSKTLALQTARATEE